MKTTRILHTVFGNFTKTTFALLLLQFTASGQGSLTPPGLPAPTMKTLSQIEPRTPISSLPFAISNSGSYYLTGNLKTGPGTNGIVITASDVTVDLAGFVLAGEGSSSGVLVSGVRSNLVIQNGTIRNWNTCIDAWNASGSRFERLQASQGGFAGIYVGDGNLVISCQAVGNSLGVFVGYDNTIKQCTALNNSSYGIGVYSGGTIVDCVSSRNQIGINASSSTIQSCTIRSNGSDGIIVSSSTVIECTVEYNLGDGISADRGLVKNCTSSWNTGDGIQGFINCNIVGNTCIGNGLNGDGAGINSTVGGHVIEKNLVATNDRGIDCNPSTGNFITGNRAQSNGTDYDIVAGNSSGAIINSPGVGFANTNPDANFRF